MTAVVMIQGGKGITRAAKQGRATAPADAAKPEKWRCAPGWRYDHAIELRMSGNITWQTHHNPNRQNLTRRPLRPS